MVSLLSSLACVCCGCWYGHRCRCRRCCWEKQRLRPRLQQHDFQRVLVTRPDLEPVRVDMAILWVCGTTAPADVRGLVVVTPLRTQRASGFVSPIKEKHATYGKIARTMLSTVVLIPVKATHGASVFVSSLKEKQTTYGNWKGKIEKLRHVARMLAHKATNRPSRKNHGTSHRKLLARHDRHPRHTSTFSLHLRLELALSSIGAAIHST